MASDRRHHGSELMITFDSPATITDAELTDLLHAIYVGEGWTDPQIAASMFTAQAVRARGQLVVARVAPGEPPAGMVILVPPTSEARRLVS